MIIETNITQICPKCKGEGIAQTQRGIEDPCGMCDGSGRLIESYVDITEIIDKLEDMSDKINDIFEKVNE